MYELELRSGAKMSHKRLLDQLQVGGSTCYRKSTMQTMKEINKNLCAFNLSTLGMIFFSIEGETKKGKNSSHEENRYDHIALIITTIIILIIIIIIIIIIIMKLKK